MKRQVVMPRLFVLIIAVILLAASPAAAVIPQTIGYQGYLTDAAGQPINGAVTIVFALYRADNSQVWTEMQSNVAVTKGVYSVLLGSVQSLAAVPFAEQYYLGIKVGGDPEMTPRQPLTSVGYAIRAGKADSASVGALTTDSIAPGAVTPAKLANVCGEGDFLVKSAGGWACSSSVLNLAIPKRPWGCSASGSAWDPGTCAAECAADAVTPSLCSGFCSGADLAAMISGGFAAQYCNR